MNPVLAVRRSFRAELIKLWRPSTAVAMVLLALLSVLATVLVISLADPARPFSGGGRPQDFNVTIEQISAASGAALGFTGGSSFIGLLVFLVFAITITLEYSQGTLRSLFLRQPHRLSWLTGRMAVMVGLVAVALLGALALSVAVGLVLAGTRGIDTSAWWSTAAFGHMASSYLNALLAAVLFGLFGTVLGLVLRSTALTLAVGVAWMFPLEHIIQNSWDGSNRVFPGLVLGVVSQGGAASASYGSSVLTGAAYATAAIALGATSLARRDITA